MVKLTILQTFTLAHASWEQDFKRLKETLEEVVWTAPPTRRWATRQFEESKKLARKTGTQAQKIRQTGRVFHAPNIDLSEVAGVLVSFFEQQRMETQALPMPEGYLVEARHRGALRAVAGLQSSMRVLLTQEGDKLMVQIGSGKWGDKAFAAAISPWFPPTLFTAGYGVWRQSRLPERAYERVQYFLEGRVRAT